MTPITIPANSIEKDDVIEVTANFRANKYRIKIIEMEELKIETEQGAIITCKAWDEDNDLTIIMDNFNMPQTWLTLDQATQLRDWLSEMIEKQEPTK